LLHPSGERTFFTSVGHLAGFAPGHVLAELPERAAPGDIVLVCGVFLSPLLVAGGRQLLQALVERGSTPSARGTRSTPAICSVARPDTISRHA
jgi:hypothetical protein